MDYIQNMGRWIIDTWLELWRHTFKVFREAWRSPFWRFILISYFFCTIMFLVVIPMVAK